jgi:hypothetical protein
MHDLFEFNRRLLQFWSDMARAQTDAVLTIACRMPELARNGNRIGPPSAEMQRMVSEKVAAYQEGAMAAGAAAIAGSAAATKGPVAAAGLMLEVTKAATKPARRRVRANAKRLSRRARNGKL